MLVNPLSDEHFSKYTFFEKKMTTFLLHLKHHNFRNIGSIKLKLRLIDCKFNVDPENVVKVRREIL